MQSSLDQRKPLRYTGLTLGKVYTIYPEANMVDILLMNGSILRKVQIIVPFANSNSGGVGLPSPKYETPILDRRNPLGEAKQNESDVFAVVGFFGSTTRPIVLGFLFPENNELLCDRTQVGNKDGTQFLWKHESNIYARIAKGDTADKTPDLEISHPSGFFMKIGSNTSLTPINNYDKKIRPFKFKNPETDQSDPAPYVYLSHPSGTKLTIKPNGEVELYVKGKVRSTVTGDVTEEIDGNLSRTIKGNLTESVKGNVSKTVKGSKSEKVTGTKKETVEGSYNKNVLGSIVESCKQTIKRSAKMGIKDSISSGTGIFQIDAPIMYQKAGKVFTSGGITSLEPPGGGVGGSGGMPPLVGTALPVVSVISKLASVYTAFASGNILGSLGQLTSIAGMSLANTFNQMFTQMGLTINLTSLNLTGGDVLSNFNQNVMGNLPLSQGEMGDYLDSWKTDILGSSGLGLSSGAIDAKITDFNSGLALDSGELSSVLGDVKDKFALDFDPIAVSTSLLSDGMSKLDLQPTVENYINSNYPDVTGDDMMTQVDSWQQYSQDNNLAGSALADYWKDTVLIPLSIPADNWGQVQGQFNIASVTGDKLESVKDSDGNIVSGSDTVKQTVDTTCTLVRPNNGDSSSWKMTEMETPSPL